VEGRFIQAPDVAGLRREALRAADEGATAVFLSAGAAGDPIVLAAGLGRTVPDLLIGARIQLHPIGLHPAGLHPAGLHPAGLHPAMLARDVASLDLVSGGRSVLCFAPPFVEGLAEAVALCRALWGSGEVVSDGPQFPVWAPANRARPTGEHSPLVAFDLSGGDESPRSVIESGDLLLRAVDTDTITDTDDVTTLCRMERV
jgi:hypothetical protein